MHDHEPTIDVIAELTEAGVGASHNQRLSLLAIAAAGGPVQMGHVAQRVRISRGAMTTIIDELVTAKLVKRVYDMGDRRTVHVELTPQGRRAIERAEKKAGLEAAA